MPDQFNNARVAGLRAFVNAALGRRGMSLGDEIKAAYHCGFSDGMKAARREAEESGGAGDTQEATSPRQ